MRLTQGVEWERVARVFWWDFGGYHSLLLLNKLRLEMLKL
jgi:hypothetical protein